MEKKRLKRAEKKDGKNLKIRYSQMCAAKQNICDRGMALKKPV